MAINKVGSKGIEDGSVATVDLAPGTVTNPKLANSSFTFDGTSISLGGSDSVNLNVSWQSVVTADGSTGTTAVAGNGYFIDTTSATHTITLPSSASIGDLVAIKDYAGTFATNNLTIARNGHNIQGAANDSLITTNRASLVLVYVDSTKGWLYWEEHNVQEFTNYITATGGTVTTSGDYKIHTFTGDGCFVVSCAGSSGFSDNVNYLVVAGGGGGGSGPTPADTGFSGGGAGGFRESYSACTSGCYSASPLATPTGITVSATTYPITVGAGGSAGSAWPAGAGSTGSNSVFSTITSTGGGGGGGRYNSGNQPGTNGKPGGSGGGAATYCTSPAGAGAGNTPPVSPSQGFSGGTATCSRGGAGGGGATAVGGSTAYSATGANGGAGVTTSISTSSNSYAGGGGGGGRDGKGCGGIGGGGAGSCSPTTATAGTTNTGGGGGGGGTTGAGGGSGGAGGKGIVIIRYKFQ